MKNTNYFDFESWLQKLGWIVLAGLALIYIILGK